jgi:hypothetical protein
MSNQPAITTDEIPADEIERRFGPAPYGVATPAPPVGTIVQFHEVVKGEYSSIELRRVAAIVLENSSAYTNRPGRPLTLLVFPPDGASRIEADVEAGDKPYPGYWTPVDTDPQAILYASWFNRR